MIQTSFNSREPLVKELLTIRRPTIATNLLISLFSGEFVIIRYLFIFLNSLFRIDYDCFASKIVYDFSHAIGLRAEKTEVRM